MSVPRAQGPQEAICEHGVAGRGPRNEGQAGRSSKHIPESLPRSSGLKVIPPESIRDAAKPTHQSVSETTAASPKAAAQSRTTCGTEPCMTKRLYKQCAHRKGLEAATAFCGSSALADATAPQGGAAHKALAPRCPERFLQNEDLT